MSVSTPAQLDPNDARLARQSGEPAARVQPGGGPLERRRPRRRAPRSDHRRARPPGQARGGARRTGPAARPRVRRPRDDRCDRDRRIRGAGRPHAAAVARRPRVGGGSARQRGLSRPRSRRRVRRPCVCMAPGCISIATGRRSGASPRISWASAPPRRPRSTSPRSATVSSGCSRTRLRCAPAGGRGGRGPAPDRGRRRRTGYRQDDDRGTDRRAARRAGDGSRRSAAARRSRRPDR